VIADSFRFSFASQGMIALAATKTASPTYVVLGSLYPRSVSTDTAAT
jgi:hypothetical protein